jgi:2,3-dihydroxyphenylpropionate 1,2-dioxygenase
LRGCGIPSVFSGARTPYAFQGYRSGIEQGRPAMSGNGMNRRATGIVGGVCMAHAPQFFTLPPTEDKKVVDRVRRLAQANGRKLKALKPDVYVTISNDHANQFALHCVPPFAIHRGGIGRGTFAGRKFEFPIASEASTALIRYLYEEGYDVSFTSTAEVEYSLGIPLSFLGIDGPILPVFVNAYVPPQPRMERCYALGMAIDRGLKAMGLRAVVVASGGLSHFPGTDRYAQPDLEFDKRLLEELETGNLRRLMALDEKTLDDTGNIELRCWAVAAGMLGERKPDKVSLDPSWHHNYATLAWWTQPKAETFAPHYPPIAPERLALTVALHRLANDEDERARYLADPKGYAKGLDISEKERKALVALNDKQMVAMGVHPFLPFMARLQIEREQRIHADGTKAAPRRGKAARK